MLTKFQKLDYKNEQIELILRKIHKDTLNWLEIGKNKPEVKQQEEPINNKQVIIIGLIMTALYTISRILTH